MNAPRDNLAMGRNYYLEDHWYFWHASLLTEFVRTVTENEMQANSASPVSHTSEVVTLPMLISKYLPLIQRVLSPEMYEIYDFRNPYIEVFLQACRNLGVQSFWVNWIASQGQKNQEGFNKLVEEIRNISHESPFKMRIYFFKKSFVDNFEECCRYVKWLFSSCSRHVVIRVDLSYLNRYSNDVYIEDIKADLERFLHVNSRKNNKLFRGLNGHIWRMHYGQSRLFHVHLFLFFKGRNGARAWYMADQIGKYWRHVITRGRGHFENCHENTYRFLGIGEINRSNDEQMDNLFRAIQYLFREKQLLPIRRSQKRFRPFGKGEIGGLKEGYQWSAA